MHERVETMECFREKVAIVTGGASGIGRTVCEALGRYGASIIVADIDAQGAREVTGSISRNGGRAWPARLDVREDEEIRKLIDETVAGHGRLDYMFNNAGIDIGGETRDLLPEHWARVLDINLKGLFFCAQRVGQVMVEQGCGKIINVGSQMGFVGGKLRAAYCSSKGGVVQLTKALAIEWAPYGINVNGVAPTFLRTPFTAAMFEDQEFYEEVVGNILFGRLGEVEDVLGAIVFLASSASDLITGHTILVDGGWTIH